VGATRRVLFIDDDPDLLATTCALLEMLNQRVDGMANAADALAMLERNHYDLLITDYDLPGMNGIELARCAKLSQPELKIVIATGYGHLDEAKALGAITLPKPFSASDLKRILA
jgi:DNA-binding NtrC family response regulator